jgi:putative ABC transport system permease protein
VIRDLLFLLRFIVRREAVEGEMHEELRAHIRDRADDLERSGLARAEAERRARLEFGGYQKFMEECREAIGTHFFETLIQDIRYGLRMLRKSPGFTAICVLTLALGIGANTAIFGVVNAVLLKPLPYLEPNRLVMVWEQNPHRGWFENIVSGANFLDWKRRNHGFRDMAAFESNAFNLAGNGRPERVDGERVTANFFSVLGVQPLEGRLFLPEEENGDRAAVIVSYGLWQERYGGDPALVKKRISLNGGSYPVVGILPATFSSDYSASSAPQSRLWISGIEPFAPEREFHDYHVIGRLKAGVSLAQAQAEMDTIASQIERQYPESQGWGVAVVRLYDQVVEYTRPALVVLLGAVGLVLLIACANVANLLLVRTTGRERETAIRTALGASRGRIARQFLVESILLSLTGAAAGLTLATWGSKILVSLSPPEAALPDAGINGVVLVFAFGVALATGIVFGLAPALSASRADVHDALKESGRSSTWSVKRGRLRDALVICEFALALTLLAGAGLAIKALAHLRAVDIGFNSTHLLSMSVPLVGPQYQNPQRQVEFFDQLLNRIETLPGVRAATVSRGIPMQGWAGWNFLTADNPNPPAADVPDANYVVIAPHYFCVMQIPLREGRPFNSGDRQGSPPVAIVSESLVQRYWPHQNPIGKRLKVSSDLNDKNQAWLSVVGVVGNVRSQGQFAPFLPEIYVPYTQYPWVLWPRDVLVRTTGDPLAIVPAMRREVAALDSEVPLANIQEMKEVVAGPLRQERTVMWLLGAFAALALMLATIGIYSVISCAVAQRTHEIGIRMALGATHRDVARLVNGHGLVLDLAGVAIGLLGAFAVTRFFSSLPFQVRWLLLFDVRPVDPLIFAAVCSVLIAVALLACYVPARRAMRVDPNVALRCE